MIKLFTKSSLLTLLVCFTTLMAKAQLGFNYSQYDIGVSASFDQVFGDVLPQKTTQAINFNITYNQTPYTNFVFEAQMGKLSGGDSTSASGRYFNNDFYSFVFRGQLQFGEFMDYSHSTFINAIKNFYISTGVGYIHNNITKINRYSYQTSTTPVFTVNTNNSPANTTTPVYMDGLNTSNTPMIPIRIGYEFKIFNQYMQPSVKIDIAYEYNYTFGNNVDGYDTGHPDAYSQISLGVKFAIGDAKTSYRKQIPY